MEEEEVTYVSSIEDQSKFCAVTEQLGGDLDTSLQSFLASSDEYPGISIDKNSLSVEGSFRADNVAGNAASKVYEITKREGGSYSRVTCCGYKFKTTSEKFFAWAAQVGGIAGLLHSLFLGVSALDLGSICNKSSSKDKK